MKRRARNESLRSDPGSTPAPGGAAEVPPHGADPEAGSETGRELHRNAQPKAGHPHIFGPTVVLFSTVLFAAATVLAKYGAGAEQLSAAWVTMARFVVGLLLLVPTMIRRPALLRPHDSLWVGLRAVSNVGAVLLFFFGIQLTAVSKANLLNMTYPVFVFLFAPAVTGESVPRRLFIFLALTLVGVWNVVRPADLTRLAQIARGDILAFASAIIAGFAISVLRRARRHDESTTIVWYVMLVGIIVNALLLPFVTVPSGRGLIIAVAAGTMGALGQFALTAGFRHVSAPAGALLSTARIPIAGVAGVVLFSDPFGPRTALGAALIMISLVGATLFRRSPNPSPEDTHT